MKIPSPRWMAYMQSEMDREERERKRAGVIFENKFLDTKPLAKKYKDSLALENIKLETLSKYFGITQSDAHRAWCDAEANAYVYLKLKEL